jgi:tetratricopeptide (TPR) repeat protein
VTLSCNNYSAAAYHWRLATQRWSLEAGYSKPHPRRWILAPQDDIKRQDRPATSDQQRATSHQHPASRIKPPALTLFTLIAFVFCLGQPLAGQTLFQNDGIAARTIGLGGPHLLGPADATATLWNPAALIGLRESQFTLTSNRTFQFSLIGLAGFWPEAGSFGITLSRFSMQPSELERLSAAWAYTFRNTFSVGLSLHGSRIEKDEFATSSIGVVWHPLGDRLPLSRDPYHTALFNVPLPPSPLAFAIQASDLPLGRRRLSRFYVAGGAVRLRAEGPAMLASFEWRGRENLTRLGLVSPVIHHFAFYSGISDFKTKNVTVGLAALGNGYGFDVVYSFAEKKILTGLAFRLGAKPGDRARRHLSRGMALAKSADYRQALKQFEHYFAYETENLKARQLADALASRVRMENEKIRKLLDEAAAQEKKFKYIDAAINYLAVLQINREDATARDRLLRLEPRLEFYIQQLYADGVQLFEEGNYLQAKKAFENILLVRRSYADAKDYLNRIDDLQHQAAEEAVYRGMGYYSQRNFQKALEAFQQALTLSPSYEKAQSLLDDTQEQIQQQEAQISRLLAEANRFSQQQQFTRAYRTYREVLDLEPENETAKQQMRLLQARIDAFVAEKLQTANRAFDRGDYNQVNDLCRQILAVSPRHEEANALLQRVGQIQSRRVEEYVRRGMDYFEAKEWNRAVEEFDKALGLDPNHKIARQKRQDALSLIDIKQLYEQAQALYNRNQFSQAARFYNSILERDPGNSAARRKLDECQRQLNLQVERYFNNGINFYAAEDYENAIREWEKALRINPNHKQSLDYKQQALQRLDALKRLRE